MPSRPFPVRVADGGRLVTSFSSENVGAQNWVVKRNMRRVARDQEGRQEGWVKFVGAGQYAFDGAASVLQLAELVRPNGDRVIVGASRQLLKKYDPDTAAWVDISGGLSFSASGQRWQTCTINGYLILNNGVDLPVSYRVEDAAVTPIHELREIGIASVGRLCEYNGFLMVANIAEVQADQLDKWMNGYSAYPVLTTSTKNANFNITGTEFTEGRRFDVTTGASTITATLPATVDVTTAGYTWIKKVDTGAGTVITSPAILNQTIVLAAQNDLALIWFDGVRYVAKVFAGGVVPADDPYGPVPSDIVNYKPWSVANSEFGEPTRWAPAFTVTMPAASATITLPFPSQVFVAGVTRVAVLNGGPDGATLGGQEATPDGVLVTGVSGNSVTLAESTDAGLTYPRQVTLLRFSDVSSIVARYDLVGDSSAIIGMLPLGDQLVLYRTTGIYVGRYTGDLDNPFVWVPRFPSKGQGLNVPIWGDAIADMNGEVHVYPGVGGRFYRFDGVTWPEIHEVCDAAKEVLFTGVQESDEVFVVANPATKQLWWCSPQRVMAYDFEFQSVSEIDAVVGAAAPVLKPGAQDRWFILAIGRFVYTYGRVTNAATNLTTYLRDGVVPTAVLKSGLIDGGDPANEKMLLAYTPILASASPDVALEVQLYATHNPSATPSALMSPVQELPTPEGENYFPTAYQALYFQDEITVVDEGDVDFRLSSRILEFDKVGEARGVTRRVT